MNKVKLYGNLDSDKVIVTDQRVIDSIRNKGFGELYEGYLILDFYESLFLIEYSNMQVLLRGKEITKSDFIELILKSTEKDNIMHKYHVYKDIRNKGYILKTGLKFGFDFRVYPKDKKIDEAHTEFVVLVWPQDRPIDMETIARSVRMSLGLHTKCVLAIVDNELEITFYNLSRVKM